MLVLVSRKVPAVDQMILRVISYPLSPFSSNFIRLYKVFIWSNDLLNKS